jgi:TRAP-type C4-dicarboxylate transport system permease small subunit
MHWKILRMRAIVIGFGAALLLVGFARAQETENTDWDHGTAPADAISTSSAINSGAARPATKPGLTQEAVLPQSSSAQEWITASLLVCIALVVLYALAKTRHRNRNIDTRTGQISGGGSL